ncbi:hypothetical protein C0J52_26362 [Blattella germanica]|nr:hypothetical protein C0J52_26362 [Blattella germanica]
MDTPNHQQYTASSDKTYNQMRCLQINLQHSRFVTDNLMNIIEKDEIGITFIQEPYLYRNRYVGINKKYRIFSSRIDQNRAAIVFSNSKIDAILVTNLTNKDAVLIEVVHGKMRFFAASLYFDIDIPIENCLAKIEEKLQFTNGAKLIIAVDMLYSTQEAGYWKNF